MARPGFHPACLPDRVPSIARALPGTLCLAPALALRSASVVSQRHAVTIGNLRAQHCALRVAVPRGGLDAGLRGRWRRVAPDRAPVRKRVFPRAFAFRPTLVGPAPRPASSGLLSDLRWIIVSRRDVRGLHEIASKPSRRDFLSSQRCSRRSSPRSPGSTLVSPRPDPTTPAAPRRPRRERPSDWRRRAWRLDVAC